MLVNIRGAHDLTLHSLARQRRAKKYMRNMAGKNKLNRALNQRVIATPDHSATHARWDMAFPSPPAGFIGATDTAIQSGAMDMATRNVRTATRIKHEDMIKPLINPYADTVGSRQSLARVIVTSAISKCLNSPPAEPNGNVKRQTVRIAHALLMKIITNISGTMADEDERSDDRHHDIDPCRDDRQNDNDHHGGYYSRDKPDNAHASQRQITMAPVPKASQTAKHQVFRK